MQIKKQRRSNSDRSAQMRARLVKSARDLFVKNGYAETSTPMLVETAGVTRGALYHHFPDKQAIFRAVVDAEAAAVALAIENEDDPSLSARERLFSGASAYMRAMQVAGRVRLLLIEGPAVLGLAEMREIEARHGDETLRIGLEEAIAESATIKLPILPLTSLLSAMFERAAMDVSDGVDETETLAVIQAVLRGVLTSGHGPLDATDKIRPPGD
ncbi:TetR/AcrR family transcriptional regulator [Hwanghaeella sp. LZ110]|uniref:TetR/AcrR family transcriptional regulator n=1 Tax=Hwanghaeella sp. LZ110 TaxID=3402810 RepID=UPI003B673BEC